ncbi:MAG: hypothetical protein K0S28_2338 [Paucimonas sp.]|nr:hypothetical protein [Paucimonas sp.]
MEAATIERFASYTAAFSSAPFPDSMKNIVLWLKSFVPPAINANRRERFYGSAGACFGLIVTALLSKGSLGVVDPWFIAPMGASAVLLFVVPSSPLAQPWSIMGGNILAALVGVTCAKLFGASAISASAAVALAIALMFPLRCLHPPSGAVALMSVLGGPAIVEMGYRFVLWPVALNSVLLLASAVLFNNALRRRYPHRADTSNQHKTADVRPSERLGFTRADLDAALKEHSEVVDIASDDLEEILQQAEMHAYRRRSGDIRCVDLMSRDVVRARPDMSLDAALMLLITHNIRALPVTNTANEIIGIITLRDVAIALSARHEASVTDPALSQEVCDVMTSDVVSASPEQPITSLVQQFSDDGFHHLPVVDANRHVIGIVTQSDLIAALYRSRLEESGQQRGAVFKAINGG